MYWWRERGDLISPTVFMYSLRDKSEAVTREIIALAISKSFLKSLHKVAVNGVNRNVH